MHLLVKPLSPQPPRALEHQQHLTPLSVSEDLHAISIWVSKSTGRTVTVQIRPELKAE